MDRTRKIHPDGCKSDPEKKIYLYMDVDKQGYNPYIHRGQWENKGLGRMSGSPQKREIEQKIMDGQGGDGTRGPNGEGQESEG